ncbi:pyridoxamine 5'-phosphate oxidase [Singulisphaera sp. PoT]|uniref:pyridoxamine 5'-phosphate oxidase n=1 Tax=Singulisphaera sp. PoT TaxID=3411797 RepID=UPI003BF52A63
MTQIERSEYGRDELHKSELLPEPADQFRRWIDDAVAASVAEVNAMTLATSTPEGRPSARIVLFKDVSEKGVTFHTSYDSRKGRELASNPYAALVVFWPALERQIRVEGRVERITAEESDAYFKTRPLGSQLGAWASHQSEVIADRKTLEAQLEEIRAKFADREIPRPPNWGGFRLIPDAYEFWQGRASRLHDRFRYRRVEPGSWLLERLSP